MGQDDFTFISRVDRFVFSLVNKALFKPFKSCQFAIGLQSSGLRFHHFDLEVFYLCERLKVFISPLLSSWVGWWVAPFACHKTCVVFYSMKPSEGHHPSSCCKCPTCQMPDFCRRCCQVSNFFSTQGSHHVVDVFRHSQAGGRSTSLEAISSFA